MSTILIVEDETVIGMDLRKRLTDAGYRVAGWAKTADEAVSMAKELAPDLILMDVQLRDEERGGIRAAFEIQRKQSIPVIFLSGHSDPTTIEQAISSNPYGFLVKPYRDAELFSTVRSALERNRFIQSLSSSRNWLFSMLHSVTDAVLACDAKGKVVYFNRAAKDLFDLTSTTDIADVFHPLDPESLEPIVGRWDGCRPVAGEYGETAIYRADGTLTHQMVTVTTIELEESDETGSAIILRDVTERRARENLLRWVAKGTAGATDDAFFAAFTANLLGALDATMVAVHVRESEMELKLASFSGRPPYTNPPPYVHAMAQKSFENWTIVPSGAYKVFQWPAPLEGYMGMQIKNTKGTLRGVMQVFSQRPLVRSAEYSWILEIFQARAAAELERAEAQKMLALLAKAIGQAHVGVAITSCGPTPQLVFSNPAFKDLTGITAGMDLPHAVDALLEPKAASKMQKLWRKNISATVESTLTAPERPIREAVWEVSPVGAAPDFQIHIVRDVSERKLLARKLQEAAKRNEQEKMNAILEAQEKERTRIAGELHDGVGVLISLLKMQASKLISDDPALNAKLLTLQQSADELATVIREISKDLMPGNLADFGLPVAVQGLCKRIAKLSGIRVECVVEGFDENLKLPNKIAFAAFRIIQEALNNAYKYSMAHNIRVELVRDGARLTIVVEDDGVGLAHKPKEKKDSGGQGLDNLKTRVGLLNGSISIESEPGNGVAIYVDLPIENNR
jgi:PAS domain S-box-containing protein